MTWLRVARATTIAPGAAIAVRVGDRDVGVYNVDGAFHAIGDLCPHQYHELHAGELCGAVVTCPLHGWRFDVTTGRPPGPAPFPRVDAYDVRVEDGWVLVCAVPRARER